MLRGSWCHGLPRRESADEDQAALMTVRTDQRLGGWRGLRAGWLKWRDDGLLRRVDFEWRLQLQHLPYPGGIVALRGVPQAEVAHLMEPAWQHVLEEAAHELVAAEAAGSRAAGLAVLVSNGDGLVVEVGDAGVGESDAKDITGEVIERRLFAVAPGGDVKHPGLAPRRVGDVEIGAPALQQRAELTAHQLGESLDGEQELPARRMPGGGVFGDPAAADQTMNVRVKTPTPTIP